jgi:hypothetical protein
MGAGPEADPNWEEAFAEAWQEAASLLDALADADRYPRDLEGEKRDADRLRLALVLLRARRSGFEDGVASRVRSRSAGDGHRRPAGGPRTFGVPAAERP